MVYGYRAPLSVGGLTLNGRHGVMGIDCRRIWTGLYEALVRVVQVHAVRLVLDLIIKPLDAVVSEAL